MSIHLIGLSGSLRKNSYNTALLHEAAALLPEDVTMEIVGIGEIPLYNADLDLPATKERPALVKVLRDKLAQADGLLIVSPEYNYSIPGGLKNVIDWASRGEDSPLLHKPVALMGATQSLWGTVRMQLAFLPVFKYLSMKPLDKPEVMIAQAQNRFDKDGKLTDATTRDIVIKQLTAFRKFILELKGAPPEEPVK